MRLIAALLLTLICAHSAPQYSGELIFPLEKWHNHSSSIVELPNGDLLVCWFHGSGERTADDVLIQAARWNHATAQVDRALHARRHPRLPRNQPRPLPGFPPAPFFLWPLIVAHKWETALMKYRISTDYQQPSGPPKWEFQDNIVLIPKDIVALTRTSPRRCRRNRPARRTRQTPDRTSRGRVLLPHGLVHPHASAGAAVRPHPGADVLRRLLLRHHGHQRRWRIHLECQRAHRRRRLHPALGSPQEDGTLVAYLRDNGPPPKRAHISFSKDDGVTWTRARDTDIPNPGTSLENIRLRNGNWIMVYNDLERDATPWLLPSATTKALPGNGSAISTAGPARRSRTSITTRR